MSFLSGLHKAEHGIQKIIIGAVLTGVTLVIAIAWGEAIQKTVSLLVNKVRCGKYLVLKEKKEYEKCQNSESVLSFYINAIATSIILYTIILIVLGNKAVKRVRK